MFPLISGIKKDMNCKKKRFLYGLITIVFIIIICGVYYGLIDKLNIKLLNPIPQNSISLNNLESFKLIKIPIDYPITPNKEISFYDYQISNSNNLTIISKKEFYPKWYSNKTIYEIDFEIKGRVLRNINNLNLLQGIMQYSPNITISNEYNLINETLYKNETSEIYLIKKEFINYRLINAFDILSLNATESISIRATFTSQRYLRNQFNISLSDTAGTTLLDPTISECGTISSDGMYTLTQAINSSGTCMTINANNVNLNCMGYTINYGNATTGNGITTTGIRTNLTIENCNILKGKGAGNSNYGIYLLTTSNSIIINNSINTSGVSGNDGIRLNTGNFNNFTDNLINATGTGLTNYGLYLYDGQQNIVSNTTIHTFGAGGTTQNYGFFIQESSNNTIADSIIVTNGGKGNHAFNIQQNSDRNIIKNNNISVSGVNSYAFNFDASSPSYPEKNNITNNNLLIGRGFDLSFLDESINGTFLINQYIGNYSFIGIGGIVYFKDSNNGEIKFLKDINGTGTNLSNAIQFGNNFVNVSTSDTGLNKSANVTFYNLPTFINPVIFKDGVQCSDCYNYTSLNAGTVIFNVTGWSNYSIGGEILVFSQINFTYPTLANGTTTTNTSLEINVSISKGTNDINTIKYNWNGTNYTMYNDSLVAMFNFDAYTQMNDTSKYGNNGTLINGAFLNESGKYNGGLQLDGIDDYINISDSNSLDLTTEFTLSAWVFKRSNTTVDSGIVSKYWNNVEYPNSRSYSLGYRQPENGGKFSLVVSSDGTGASAKILESVLIPQDNVWYYVTGVFNSSTFMRIYLNGILDNETISGVPASAYVSTAPVSIGTVFNLADARYFNGTIDEVRIWNRSLGSTEIYEQYVSNLQKYNSTQWYLYIANQSQNATTGLGTGVYTYQAMASDTSNNWNYTDLRQVTIGESDTEYPIFSLYWDDNGTLSGNGIGHFNVTLLSTNTSVYLEINNTNYSASNFAGAVYNVSVNFTNTGNYTYQWISWGNGTSKLYNVSGNRSYTVNVSAIDNEYPIFSNPINTIPNGSQYSPSIKYSFNITILSTNTSVQLEFNGVNYTATNFTNNRFNVTLNNIGTGNYSYQWNAFGNGTNHYYNVSNVYDYAVKINGTYMLGISGTSPITYGTATDVSGSSCPSQITCSLSPANAIYGAGSQLFNYSTEGNSNYTANSTSINITINRAGNTLNLSLNGLEQNLSITYPQQVNVSVSGNQTTITIDVNGTAFVSGNNYTLGVGLWRVNASTQGNQNYSSNETLLYIEVNQSSQSITPRLNQNNANLSIIYPQQINVTFTGTNQTAVSISLNGTSLIIGNNYTIGVGLWTLNYSTPSNQNYSQFSDILRLEINQTTGNIVMKINSTEANQTANYLTQTNVSATTLYGTITLYRNGADVSSENHNFTTLGGGSYNYTAVSSGNQNYSSTTLTRWVLINNETGLCDVLFNETSPLNYPQKFKVYTNCNSGFALTRNSTSIANNSVQSLGAGTYNFTVLRTDRQNYTNFADEEYFTISQISSSVNLTLNNTQANITIVQSSIISLNCSKISGDSSSVLKIYNNGTLINSGISPRGNNTNFTNAGLMNITCIYEATQNYTLSSESWWVNVTALITDTTKPTFTNIHNLTIQNNESIASDFNATDETAFDSFKINWTSLFSINSTGFLTNISGLNISTYYINVSINDSSGNQDSLVIWVNVTNATADAEYPLFSNSLTSPINGSQYSPTTKYYFNITILSTNTSVQLEFNGINYTATNFTKDRFNVTLENLGAGNYTYQWNAFGNGSSRLYNVSNVYDYSVSINRTLTLGITGTTPITYGTITDVAGSGCPAQLTCTIAPANAIYGAGSQLFNYSTEGNSNYTANWTYKTITINQATGSIFTYIDGNRANKNSNNNTPINISTNLSVGLGNITLYVNGTLYNNGSGWISNNSEFVAGVYNISGIYLGNENYTWSEESWTLRIINYTTPVVSNVTSAKCRYKYFGYWNDKLPFYKESGCI